MTLYALHPEALEDLDDLQAYIAEDNPDAADRVRDEIRDAILAFGSVPSSRFSAA
jgi:plasmid stabilization system protein ParE